MMGKNWLWILLMGKCLIGSLLLTSHLQAGNVSYVYDELNRLTQAIYDDGKIVTYTYDKAGNRRVKDVAQLQEKVSTPTKPTGPTSGTAEVSPYSATGASSDLGHPVQYLFDWDRNNGDGVEN